VITLNYNAIFENLISEQTESMQ